MSGAKGLVAGLKVVELGWGLAASLTGMLFADNGADVIKVEPLEGDPYREIPAAKVWNRGKRSWSLDLKTEEGRKRYIELCAGADVVIDALRPGASDRHGCGDEVLRSHNPALVYCAISAYGRDDPRRDLPGYDPLISAWMGLTNEQQGRADRPRFPSFPIGSYGAAFNACIGVLAALHHRAKTGRGQLVETSLYDGALSLLTMSWCWNAKDPPLPSTRPRLIPSLPRRHMITLGVLKCSDGGYLQIHTGPTGHFALALRVLGLDGTMQNPPPSLEKSTPLSDDERAFLLDNVPKIVAAKPLDVWLAAFDEAGIACVPVDPPGKIFSDPQIVFDAAVVTVDDPELGSIRMVAPLPKCEQAPAGVSRPAPGLGEHNGEGFGSPARHSSAGAGSQEAPLKDLKIVDFGNFYAGPAATRILSDLGADVIKVEPPSGDPMRPTRNIFRMAQRGKRSLGLDMKAPAGRDIAHRLIAEADIVTHNMRENKADKVGLGFAELAALNSDLIYLRSPGFGSAGPRAHQASFAPLLSAMCGIQTEAAGKGQDPIQNWISNEDVVGSCLGAIWLLMALYRRDQGGKAVEIENSLLRAAMFAGSHVILDQQGVLIPSFEIDSEQLGTGPLCRLYEAQDGWIMLAVLTARDQELLRRSGALFALTSETAGDLRDVEGIDKVLEAWFRGQSASAALEILSAAGVPAELARPRQGMAFLSSDEKERLVSYKDVDVEARDIGHLIRFSDMPTPAIRSVARLGEHSDAILRELDKSDEDIAELRDAKVVV